jgi:DNA-binding transcriptional MerR regulator
VQEARVIRIGDFARLGQVSVVTLRHYDDIGLLKPERVDQFTGYRYYSVGQLGLLNRILALKDLGFSLQQIDQVLGGVTLEQLRGMLKMKRAEVDQAIADERERLSRITARLRQIELENFVPNYDVVLKEVPPMLVASRRVTIPTNAEVPHYLGGAFDETYGLIASRGANPAGPCLAVWHQPAAVLENEDAEGAVPLEKPLEGTDRVKVYELPGGQFVSAVHDGPFETMSQAHAAILSWIESNGYEAAGTYREVYLGEAGEGGSDPVTEIQYPVAKAAPLARSRRANDQRPTTND